MVQQRGALELLGLWRTHCDALTLDPFACESQLAVLLRNSGPSSAIGLAVAQPRSRAALARSLSLRRCHPERCRSPGFSGTRRVQGPGFFRYPPRAARELTAFCAQLQLRAWWKRGPPGPRIDAFRRAMDHSRPAAVVTPRHEALVVVKVSSREEAQHL